MNANDLSRNEPSTILSTYSAPLSPGSLENKYTFSDEKRMLYFSNFLDSTWGVPYVLQGPRGSSPVESSRESRRNTVPFCSSGKSTISYPYEIAVETSITNEVPRLPWGTSLRVLRATMRINPEITLSRDSIRNARNNSLDLLRKSLNFLRKEPGGGGPPQRGPGNPRKPYEMVRRIDFTSMLIQFTVISLHFSRIMRLPVIKNE